jgi:hypothetical protein
MTDEVPTLSIGAVLGDSDPDSMAWSRAIGMLSSQVQILRDGVTSPVRLSIAYHVDGRLAPNDFEGVRTGRFDKRSGRLVVQAAVSRAAVHDRRASLFNLLDDALAEAERYVLRKGLASGLPEIRGLVAKLPRD